MPDLQIVGIKLRDFRSYESLELGDIGRLTVFVGPNAAGKSNIVEGVQLVTALTSFRNARAADMVRRGSEEARVAVHATDGNRELDLALEITEGRRHYKLNGKPKRTQDLRGIVPAVAFTPDDLDIAKGSNGRRRRSLDALGMQLNANYRQIFRDFEKVLAQKNALLKDGAPSDVVEATNFVFQHVGKRLSEYRQRLFERLAPHLSRLYSEIAGPGEKAVGEYVVSEIEEASVEEELRRGRALAGPHLDGIELFIDDLPAAKFASQGQQRSLVLAWKLAEAELVEEILGQLPVLLLDDVMSELDARRRGALVNYLSQGAQTFVTTANIDYFDQKMLKEANVIELG